MAIDVGTVIDNAARSDSINSGGLPIDMEPQTALLEPNSYMFEALTREIGEVISTDQMKHEYRERRLIPNSVELAAAAAAGASNLNVGTLNATRIKNDFYLYIPSTGELVLVQDAAIDATVDIVRNTGSGTLINAAVLGAKVLILGEGHAEGEEVPAAYSNQSVSKYSYVMQKDRRVQNTDIEEAIKHYDNSEERMMQLKVAFIEYKREQNLLFYVGQGTREVASASGPRRHCCSGVFELFTENNYDLTSTTGLTIETLASILADTKFRGASSESKISLFGTNGWKSISAWPLGSLRLAMGEKKFGLKLNKIVTGFGEVDVGFDPVLNVTNGLDDRGIIFDTAHVRQMRLANMAPKIYRNIPNLSTLHATVDAISGTFGLQAKFPELHAQIKGIK